MINVLCDVCGHVLSCHVLSQCVAWLVTLSVAYTCRPYYVSDHNDVIMHQLNNYMYSFCRHSLIISRLTDDYDSECV